MVYDVIVMGSINMDILVFVNDFPNFSENVVAKNMVTHAGGKGANQAVAVAKQGVKHTFIGAMGDDGFGDQIKEMLTSKGVDLNNLIIKENLQTGTAVGIVDKQGENTFVGVLGANMSITSNEIEDIFAGIDGKVFLLQMETSKESVLAALKAAKSKGMFVILDPAPEGCFFEEALKYADLVTPNSQETEKITGIKITDLKDAKKAAQIISDSCVPNVIVKMGAKGSLLYEAEKDQYTLFEAKKVKVIDTVGAGDTFAGVLASVLSEDTNNICHAIKVATQASALKVSRDGGQDAIPTKKELAQFDY